MSTHVDDKTLRCPKLGSEVTFHYCRTCGESLPVCDRILTCWWEFFDVQAHVQKILNDEEFNRLLQPQTKPRVVSLIEMIQQCSERCGK